MRIINRGLVQGKWWALCRGPREAPMLFRTKREARDLQNEDEYILPVLVMPELMRDDRH